MALSSRGLGRRPLTAVTRVRIPLGLKRKPHNDGFFSLLVGFLGDGSVTRDCRRTTSGLPTGHRRRDLMQTVIPPSRPSRPCAASPGRVLTVRRRAAGNGCESVRASGVDVDCAQADQPGCATNDGRRDGSETPDSRRRGAAAHTARRLHSHLRHDEARRDDPADRWYLLPNRFEHQDDDGGGNRTTGAGR